MKRRLSMLLVAAMLTATLLTGCGGGGSQGGEAGGGTLDRVLADGKVTIGCCLGGAPIGFYDDTGKAVGFDPDWAQKCADELGVELEVIEVTGENRISYLNSGRIDFFFADCTANTERAKTVEFTIPYLHAGVKMLTRSDTGLNTVEDCNDPSITVGVGRGTTGEDLVLKNAPNAKLVYVDAYSEQVLSLEQGKCDAIFEDSSVIDYSASQSGGKLVSPDTLYSSDPICAAVRRGDTELLNWLNLFISKNISDGWMRDTYYKWWGAEPAELVSIW